VFICRIGHPAIAPQRASGGKSRPAWWLLAVLGHAKKGIVGTYDVWTYADEKREALEVWGRYVESLESGDRGKVVALRA